MQYWIFYVGGVGGDGFRNLLEHADNIMPIDGAKTWKLVKLQDRYNIKNEKIKFRNTPFSTSKEFLEYLKTHDPIHDFPNINPAECTLIDIEQVWRDWDYLNNILISIGITLDRKYYEEYLDVSKRRPK